MKIYRVKELWGLLQKMKYSTKLKSGQIDYNQSTDLNLDKEDLYLQFSFWYFKSKKIELSKEFITKYDSIGIHTAMHSKYYYLACIISATIFILGFTSLLDTLDELTFNLLIDFAVFLIVAPLIFFATFGYKSFIKVKLD